MSVKKLKSFFEAIVGGAAACMSPAILSPELLQVEVYRLAAEKRERTPAQITVDRMLEELYLKHVIEKYEAGQKPDSYLAYRVNNYGPRMSVIATMERLKAFDSQPA